MEEGRKSEEGIAEETTLDAGGVFWLNAVNQPAGNEVRERHCAEECRGKCCFKVPKKIVRPDDFWKCKLFP